MKIALVTGANKGIGLEVAKQLAQKGFFVYLGSRNEESGVAAAEMLKEEGIINVEAVQLDVTKQIPLMPPANRLKKKRVFWMF